MNFFRRYKVHVLIFVLAAFALTLGLNFGQLAGLKGSPTDSVVDVNGDSIPLYLFENYYDRALSQLPPAQSNNQEARDQKKKETIQELVTSTVMEQQAKHFGIEVPDQQVIGTLANIPQFQQDGRFSREAYARALAYQLKTSPQEFEDEQRRQIEVYKLSWLIRSSVRITDPEFDAAYAVLSPSLDKEVQTASKTKLTPAQVRAAARDRLQQEVLSWTLSQWYSGLNQHIKVKVHAELLQDIH